MKIPQAHKLSSGTWYIYLRINGEGVSISAPTKKEVEHKAALIKAEHINNKRTAHNQGRTLSEAIDKYIIERRNVLSPATIRGYKSIQRLYFADIMHLPIHTIKTWQESVNSLASAYSPKTVKNAWRFIASIISNEGLTPPKIKLPQQEHQEKQWLDPQQIQTFIDAIRDTPVEMAALLGLHGLRRSEIIALTRKNVNLKANTLTISGAIVHDESGKLIAKKTNKTFSSTRTMPIMIPRLTEIIEQSQGNRLVTTHPNTIYKQVNTICAKNNLPLVGVHGLRHSFASLGYFLKIPEEQIARWGGWTDYNTIHKIYLHLAQQEQDSSLNAMKTFFASKL